MRVLALDLGFNLGFAVLGRKYVRSGSHKLAGSSFEMGEAFRALRDRVLRLHAEHKPDIIAVAALFVTKYDNPVKLRPIIGFACRLQEIADELKLPYHVFYESDARKALLSPATVPRKSEDIKRAVHAACAARKWPATDYNASDALCIANFAMSKLEKDWAYQTQPLFAGAKPRRGANRNHAWAG